MMQVRPWRIVRPKLVPHVAATGRAVLLEGDSALLLKSHADNSIDAIVTDPPYALVSIVKRFGDPKGQPAKGNQAFVRASAGFMGQRWDNGDTAHSVAFWAECLRVLKPGGFVLAFGGTRTYHRLACAIEDAGFEIRDMVQWLYGSGFPKSHDVSKGIDRAAGAERTVKTGVKPGHEGFTGGSMTSVQSLGGTLGGEGGFDRPWMNDPDAVDRYHHTFAPATDAARQWEGWGTALKPACEPICMARKPLSEGTVAANVLRWGTGAINIDGCRVGTADDLNGGRYSDDKDETESQTYGKGFNKRSTADYAQPQGRWPANVITDGSDEVVAMFPTAPGQQRYVGPEHGDRLSRGIYGDFGPRPPNEPRSDSGSAVRFFYQAKATKKDRAGSRHPTVKPIALLRYLCRLVTPPGGTVLDPFAGTGTTGEACHLEGFRVVMMEREARFADDIRSRMKGLNVELTGGTA